MHGHKKLRQFLWFAIIFFVVTAFQTFGYVNYNKGMLEQQSVLAFREQLELLRLTFLQRLEQQFVLLEALADDAAKEDDFSKESVEALWEDLSLFPGYNKMIGVEVEGWNIDEEGVTSFFGAGSKTIEIQAGRRVTFLEDESRVQGTLALSVPMRHEETEEGMLIAYIDGDKLFQDISGTFFNGRGSFYLADAHGDILGADGKKLNSNEEKNVYSFMASKETVDNINNYEGVFKYKEKNEEWFSAFQPSGLQDIYIFSLAPNSFTRIPQGEYENRNLLGLLTLVLVNLGGYIALYFAMRKATKTLENENNCFKTAEEVAGIISFVGDYEKDEFVLNDSFEKQIGRAPIIRKISDFAKPYPFVLEEDQGIFAQMGLDLMQGKETGHAQYRILGKDGNIQWQQFVYRVWYDRQGAPVKCYGMIMPIDQQMKVISKLQMQVEKDPLTGVLNRIAFENYVNTSVNGGFGEDHNALLLLDLDDFKQINDGYGHVLGDHVLVATADILKACVRNSDYVGRLGGDEFAVFLKGVNKEQSAKKAGEICEALEREEIKSNEAAVTCSIGIACFPQNGESVNELYQRADRALYKVKGTGKNSYSFSE